MNELIEKNRRLLQFCCSNYRLGTGSYSSYLDDYLVFFESFKAT